MVVDTELSLAGAQPKVLEGIRVLDFGRFIAGPCAAAILGDLGAEVIRVDKRGGSEDRVMIPVTEQGEGAMFLQNNRNKRSITLNPAKEGGAEVVRRLVAQSDIVIANLPFPTIKSMKLDIDSLREVRPDVILLMSSAYGSGGPYSDRLGFDGVGQVMSGAVYRSGTPEQPVRTMVPYVDYATGLSGVIAVLAALRHRDMTGEGQLVETSLLASALMISSGFLIEQAVLGCDRKAMLNRAQLAAPVDMFKVTDGWIFVQAVGDTIYARWARLMGEEEPWLTEPRFATDALRGDHGEEISARMVHDTYPFSGPGGTRASPDSGIPCLFAARGARRSACAGNGLSQDDRISGAAAPRTRDRDAIPNVANATRVSLGASDHRRPYARRSVGVGL